PARSRSSERRKGCGPGRWRISPLSRDVTYRSENRFMADLPAEIRPGWTHRERSTPWLSS
ncbi:hypothetical protein KBZ20_17160, partial [Vulcanococcus limneticus Candia 3F8]|uniref:hypothetical protein n=1 Tax=Vulcanococcus limneticus TaxID=2170428 RepID=UPI0020CD09B5